MRISPIPKSAWFSLLIAILYSKKALSWSLTPITLMPWVTSGVSVEKSSEQRSNLSAASEALSGSLGKKTIQLDALYLKDNQTPVASLAVRLRDFRGISELNDAALETFTKNKKLLIQPFLCTFGKETAVITQVSTADKWLTLSVASEILASSPDPQEQKYNLSSSLSNTTRKALEEAAKAKNFDHNLKFSVHPETSGENQGNPTCLHLLLISKMIAVSPFTPEVDASDYGKIVLGQPSPALTPSRSTRKLMIRFSRTDLDFDQSFSADIRIVESVLGRTYPDPISLKLQLSKKEKEVELSSIEPLLEFAKRESVVLGYASDPEIRYKDRAWVYVDKGRAWGLKIGDRLLSKGGEIKGHVVAYYGPEMKIKDTNNNPIVEGAIIYIRRGQDLTSIGQKLSWDPREFPTSWPVSEK